MVGKNLIVSIPFPINEMFKNMPIGGQSLLYKYTSCPKNTVGDISRFVLCVDKRRLNTNC